MLVVLAHQLDQNIKETSAGAHTKCRGEKRTVRAPPSSNIRPLYPRVKEGFRFAGESNTGDRGGLLPSSATPSVTPLTSATNPALNPTAICDNGSTACEVVKRRNSAARCQPLGKTESVRHNGGAHYAATTATGAILYLDSNKHCNSEEIEGKNIEAGREQILHRS
jgi:hypothetical protein